MNKVYIVGGCSYEDSMSHHGIKGQKWGERRYQNPDGTLTGAPAVGVASYQKVEGNKYKVKKNEWNGGVGNLRIINDNEKRRHS